jgi:hypothetical protein
MEGVFSLTQAADLIRSIAIAYTGQVGSFDYDMRAIQWASIATAYNAADGPLCFRMKKGKQNYACDYGKFQGDTARILINSHYLLYFRLNIEACL